MEKGNLGKALAGETGESNGHFAVKIQGSRRRNGGNSAAVTLVVY